MKKLLLFFMAPVFSLLLCASLVFAADNDQEAMAGYDLSNATYAVFSNTGITVSGVQAGLNDLVDSTTLYISKEGTYILSGSCANGHIAVKKGTGNVKLILNSLVLTAETASESISDAETAINIKGKNEVTIEAVGNENVITSNIDDSTAIKSSKNLTFAGDGTLTVNGNKKNAIKADNILTIKSGLTLNVNAQKNAIAADEELLIEGGDITVTATEGDALRSDPDALELTEDGTAVAGTNGLVTIKGGKLNLTAGDDGIQGDYKVSVTGGNFTIRASGDGITSNTDVEVTSSNSTSSTVTVGTVAISGNIFNINALGDGIQAGTDLTIDGGSYDIMTNNGYETRLADDADSCKGLKAGSTLSVTDGIFTINSADDAIHSNEYVSLTGGQFDIYTGDDGAHGDTSLIVGKDGAGESLPSINIISSYEGLEAGTVYIYSGDIQVVSSDDGINAAGKTSSGDSFNPGGGFPGRGGNQISGSGDYAINIYGGKIYVNADGDGLDSNGTIAITGGNVTVYGQAAGGDNNPLDSDSGCSISAGATVFAAGSSAMSSTVSVNGQGYYLSSKSSQGGPGSMGGRGGMGGTSTTVTAGSTISILSDSDVIASFVTPKTVDYIFYTSPAMAANGNYTMSTSAVTQKKVTSITATQANVELTIEETGKINISVSPADATNTGVSYVSSDPAVAAVNSDGTITALSEGTAIITITAKDGSNVSTTVTVKVNKKAEETTEPDDSTADTANKDTESTTTNIGNDTTKTDVSTESTSIATNGNNNFGTTTTVNTEQVSANTTAMISNTELAKNTLTINAGLKVSQTKKQINVSWGAVNGADGYDVYAAYCSSKFKEPVMTIKSSRTKAIITMIDGKKINLKQNFKVYVIAYKLVGSNKVTLAKTITAHVVGLKNTKYTNVKKIKLTKTKVTLAIGKTSKIKAKTVLVSKSKKQLSNKHAQQFRYASSDKSVATVSSKGVIKAVGKGSCKVYVYARNGYAKAVTVKVK